MTQDEFNALTDLFVRGTANPDQAYVCLVFNRNPDSQSLHGVWFSTDIDPEKLSGLFNELAKSENWAKEYTKKEFPPTPTVN